jgi:uncharacterized coiled-coil protein SlyX
MSLTNFFFANNKSGGTGLRQLNRLVHFEKMKSLQKSVEPPSNTSTDLTNLSIESLNKRVNQLEEVIGFQSLIIQGILSKLDEKELISKNDIRDSLAELDELDGVKDGKLNINTLLYLLSQNT